MIANLSFKGTACEPNGNEAILVYLRSLTLEEEQAAMLDHVESWIDIEQPFVRPCIWIQVNQTKHII